MYSGPSALLLEPFLRVMILERGFGCTSVSNPIATYATLTFAYGLYKAFSHLLRGFPVKTLLIDLLLTPLAIPVVLLCHAAATEFLGVFGSLELLPCLAVFITKVGCDTLIGLGIGIADKESNLRRRMADYHVLLHDMLGLHSRITSIFPEADIRSLLADPEKLKKLLDDRAPDIWQEMAINALDLMHIWFYQPRANYAVMRHIRRLTLEEKLVFLNMQQVLCLEKQISQMLVNGLVGRNFAGALSFYLSHNDEYLCSMEKLCLQSETNA